MSRPDSDSEFRFRPPAGFLKFIENADPTVQINIESRNWQAFRYPDEFREEINVNGQTNEQSGIAACFALIHQSNGTKHTNGYVVSLDSLSNSIAFASLNDEYLLMLPDESIVVLTPDTIETMLVADSWSDFSSNCLVSVNAGRSSSSLADIAGFWKPIESDTLPKPFFDVACPSIEISLDGNYIETFPDGRKSTSLCQLENMQLNVFHDEGNVVFHYDLYDDILELTQVGGRFHCRFVRAREGNSTGT